MLPNGTKSTTPSRGVRRARLVAALPSGPPPHRGEVVVYVKHRVTVMDRRRAHQEVDGSGGTMLPSLGELVLRGVDPAPRTLGNRGRDGRGRRSLRPTRPDEQACRREQELRPRGLADMEHPPAAMCPPSQGRNAPPGVRKRCQRADVSRRYVITRRLPVGPAWPLHAPQPQPRTRRARPSRPASQQLPAA